MGSKNEIRYGSGFFKDASKLPRQAREKLALLIVILEENPFDSRLHTKQLSQPLQDMYSFEKDLSAIHPENKNIKPKIRQQLQFLRNKGYHEFVEAGKYRLK